MELEFPKSRYESCAAQNFYPKEIMKKYKKIGVICTMAFFVLAQATLITSYVPAAIAAIYSLQEETQNHALPKKLPYYCWMPFRYDTAKTYLLALGYQCIPMFSYCYR